MPKKTKLPTIEFTLMDPAVTQKIASEAEQLAKDAIGLKVTTADESVTATGLLGKIQKLRRFADKAFKDVKGPITAFKKGLDADHNAAVGTLEKLEASVERPILEFRRADEKRRADAAAEEMRIREAAARAEQEQRAAELREAAAAATTKSVAKLLNKQAEIVANAQPVIDPVNIEHGTVDTLGSGAHARKNKHGLIVNFERLVLQVAAQIMVTKYGAPPQIAGWLAQFKPNAQASAEILMPKMPAINQLVNRMADDLALEGVTAEADESIITR